MWIRNVFETKKFKPLYAANGSESNQQDNGESKGLDDGESKANDDGEPDPHDDGESKAYDDGESEPLKSESDDKDESKRPKSGIVGFSKHYYTTYMVYVYRKNVLFIEEKYRIPSEECPDPGRQFAYGCYTRPVAIFSKAAPFVFTSMVSWPLFWLWRGLDWKNKQPKDVLPFYIRNVSIGYLLGMLIKKTLFFSY